VSSGGVGHRAPAGSERVLVIGAGPGGLEAARLAAALGSEVLVVEKQAGLGGTPIAESYAALTHGFRSAEEAMGEMMAAAVDQAGVTIQTSTEVTGVSGSAGHFLVTLSSGDPVEAGAIIIATGFQHFDPGRETQQYGYYEFADVITLVDAEKMLKAHNFVTPSTGEPPKRVAFIQCVGSRDRQIGNEYCSKVCCGISSKQAIEVRLVAAKAHFLEEAPNRGGVDRADLRRVKVEIEIEVATPQAQMEIFAPPGMEELTQQIQGMFQNLGGARKKQRKLKIGEAMKMLTEEEAGRLVNDEDLRSKALANAEQNGIVFIDEIDKIVSRSEVAGADVSRQGVQRDLLPLVEGTTVSTKYGMVKTDHILFIASGAFHLAKPSDLIPELQGRLPIRVELDSLSVADFERILTGTDACLTRQYQALLATEEVELSFRPEGIRRLAEIAHAVNDKTENIGARRLYTVMEKLLEEISFDAGKRGKESLTIDAGYVDAKLKDLAASEDLARYVL